MFCSIFEQNYNCTKNPKLFQTHEDIHNLYTANKFVLPCLSKNIILKNINKTFINANTNLIKS